MSGAVALVFEFSGPKLQQKETIEILRGENALQIATELKAEDYINSKILFLARVVKIGALKNLKAGEYDFKGDDVNQIVDKLVAGKTAAKKITIIPGWTIQDITVYLEKQKIVTKDEFIAAAKPLHFTEFDFLTNLAQTADLEGYLYPDTYQINNKALVNDVIGIMLKNFGQKLTADAKNKIQKQDKSINQIVIMASMLEKEIKTLEDKKLVSGILWKRLKSNIPLQVDSTLLYYKTGAKTVDKNIDSPYNTYKYTGLPPGPICNPGQDSIEAAIEPLDSPYWYYLTASDGTTVFSENYGQHLINKAKYLDIKN